MWFSNSRIETDSSCLSILTFNYDNNTSFVSFAYIQMDMNFIWDLLSFQSCHSYTVNEVPLYPKMALVCCKYTYIHTNTSIHISLLYFMIWNEITENSAKFQWIYFKWFSFIAFSWHHIKIAQLTIDC